MAQLARLNKTLQDGSGNALSSATFTIYREGATVSGAQSGTSPLSVTVRDLGKVVAADTVFVNTTTGTVYTVASVTGRTTMSLTWLGGGTLNLADGDRLIPSGSQPTLYADDQGGATKANPLTSSSTGLVQCWMEFGTYDGIAVSGATKVLDAGFTTSTENPGQIRYADDYAVGSSTGGIQEAINDLPSGGTVRLSGNKTYSYSAAISVATADITVEGAGDTSLLQATSANGTHCFDVTAHRFTLRNCKIDGQNGTKTVGRGVFIEDTYNDTTIDNVYFLNTPDAAVGEWITHTRTRVMNCRIVNPGDAGSTDAFGIALGTSSSFFKILNNYIDAPSLANSDAIFIGLGSTDGEVRGNTCVNGGNNGIRFGSTRIVVADNICTGFTTDGFRVDSTNGIVVNNVAKGCGNGFKCGSNTADTIIGFNEAISNTNGIYVNSTTDTNGLKIIGNTCKSNTARGIGALVGNVALTKCDIIGNTCESNSFSGISIDTGGASTGTVTDLLIANNYCKTNTLKGILISPANTGSVAWTNIVIRGNSCIGNTQQGIEVDAHGTASTITIAGNYYQGNSANELITPTNWTVGGAGQRHTDIASGATIVVAGDGYYQVTGTADITSITAASAGTRITLHFTGTAATNGIVDGSNLKLAGNFVYSPDDTMELVCDGTNWYELGRSAN